ncbi:CAP domain-containing protein [Candidatus Saccharibacteria bacterium]|nr:CAP domain-containing protein [Candidatus Saccharibacteria bacterium]
MMAFATKQKPATRHKKRVGSHHRQDKHYVKHYWPYLPMLAIVSLGILANTVWTQRNAVLGASSQTSALSLLDQTNQIREANNVNDLTLSTTLSRAATAKANDMVAHDYWSHNTPEGVSPWRFITDAGYHYQSAGENLAYGFSDSQQTILAWLHSPEHRDNLLNTTYSQVGFGIVHASDYLGKGPTTLVVAMYAKPGVSQLVGIPKTGNVEQAVKGASTPGHAVTRIQVAAVSGISVEASVIVALSSLLLVAYVLGQHGMAWRRQLIKGEQFVLAHPALDLVIISLATAGFIVSRTAGFVL